MVSRHGVCASQRGSTHRGHRNGGPGAGDVLEYVSFADYGGLMAYAPNILENYRRAATYVDKILKGANPGDCPSSGPPRSTSWSTSRRPRPSA